MSKPTRKEVLSDQRTLTVEEKKAIEREWIKEYDSGKGRAKLERLFRKGGSVKALYERGIPEINWKIPNLLSDTGKMFIFGASGTGKSFAAMQLALAATNKEFWLAFHEVRQQRVLYLDGEMHTIPFFHNLAHLMRGGDYEYSSDFVYYPTGILCLEGEEGRVVLDGLCREHRPDIIILDTIRCFISGGEDKPEHFKSFIENLDLMGEEYGVAFVMLQHMPKTAAHKKGPLRLEDIYGSVAQGGWLDSAVGLQRVSDHKLAVYHSKTRLVSKDEVSDYQVVIPRSPDRAYRYKYDAALTESKQAQNNCFDDCLVFLYSLVADGRSDVKGKEWGPIREKYSEGTFYRARDRLKEQGYLRDGDTSAIKVIVVERFVDDEK